jgi:hypothetical protein
MVVSAALNPSVLEKGCSASRIVYAVKAVGKFEPGTNVCIHNDFRRD